MCESFPVSTPTAVRATSLYVVHLTVWSGVNVGSAMTSTWQQSSANEGVTTACVHGLAVMRRSALRAVGGVGIVAAGLAVAGLGTGPRHLEIVHQTVTIPSLPPAWEGLRIAHLSDFHVGERNVSKPMLLRARRAVEAWQPDIVAFTGDYFHDGRMVPDDGLFGNWSARIGTFAVLGNHDVRAGEAACAQIIARLEAGGVTLLRNSALALEREGQSIWIAGVDDPHTWHSDVEQAFAGVPPAQDVLLLLAHSPAVIRDVPLGRVRLTLCGHTHGGQVRVTRSGQIPGLKVVRRLVRDTMLRNEPQVFRGWHWLRGGLLLVSNGVGVSRVPARLFSRPQVHLLELTAQGQNLGRGCDDPQRYLCRSGGVRFRISTRLTSLRSATN